MVDGERERRKHPRSKSGFALAATDDGLLRRVDNISVTGVLCHTSRAVEEMTRMSIDIELPGSDGAIHAEGVVVRCDAEDGGSGEYRVAIVFTKVKDSDQHLIREYVDRDLAAS